MVVLYSISCYGTISYEENDQPWRRILVCCAEGYIEIPLYSVVDGLKQRKGYAIMGAISEGSKVE